MSNNTPYGPTGGGATAETRVWKKVDAWCLDPLLKEACGKGERDTPSVTFSVHMDLFDNADEDATIDLSDVKFRVIWSSGNTGCGADCQQVDFDPTNGSSGVVQASGLTLMYSYPGDVVTDAHPNLKINMSVAIGTAAKAGQGASLQYTVKVPVIPDLLQPIVFLFGTHKIPDWAVCARLINTDITSPTIEMDQLQAVGGNAVSNATIGKGSIDCVPIARGLGARWFTIINPDPDNEVLGDYAVQFDLCPN